jgi:short-subunit dehydrogenase
MYKVVLVTGASSGIGKITAEFLSQKGFKVYGTSRKLFNHHGDPKQNDLPFDLIQLDLNNIETIKSAVNLIIKKEGKIDVLINNAGNGITGPVEETPTDEIRKAFETNLFGIIELIQLVIPHMRKQRNGLIINITSIGGYMGLPFRGIYCSIKAALEILTESIRMEVKKFGIHVTNIAPGDFATNIASGRYHTPFYDDSPYKDVYQKNVELMDYHVDKGSDPIEMAKYVHGIILKSNPNIHYKVGGFIDKISIKLKRILPGKFFEKLIMKNYGM